MGEGSETLLRRWTQVAAMASLAVLSGFSGSYGQQFGDAGPRETSVTVNGVRLHYADWGGDGETLLFLMPNGGSVVRQFGAIAPQFTNGFHVMGLTRRGLAPSEKPTSGYDTATLVRDIVAFLDVMGIQRVSLAGHSVAGAEMTRLAGDYPDRVSKLVYLDAANDYKWLGEIASEAGVSPPRDAALAAVLRGAGESHPDYSKVNAPSLDIVVVYETTMPVRPEDDEAYKRYVKLVYEKDFIGEQIRQFRTKMRLGTVLTLHHTDHNAFLRDPMQLSIVIPAMRKFLAGK
jgi:pimeloyl-ACP methyl ester carboxylesterase